VPPGEVESVHASRDREPRRDRRRRRREDFVEIEGLEMPRGGGEPGGRQDGKPGKESPAVDLTA